MSEPTPELNKALAKVQGELPTVSKDKKVNAGAMKYKYADLADVVQVAYPLMAKNGLSWTALPTYNEQGQFVLAYSLRHESGEMLEGWYPLPTNGTPQQMGSSQTYSRRYALSAFLGIATDDDDGQAAEQTLHRSEPPKQKIEPVTDIRNMVDRLKKEAPHKTDELKAFWSKVAPGTKAESVPRTAGKALETKINELIAEAKRADEPVLLDEETGEVLNPKADSPVSAAREALNATKGADTPEGWETN